MGTRSQISIWERACRAQFLLRAFLPFLKDRVGKRNGLSNGVPKWKLGDKLTMGQESTMPDANGNRRSPQRRFELRGLGDRCDGAQRLPSEAIDAAALEASHSSSPKT